jgi:hypothetical protein
MDERVRRDLERSRAAFQQHCWPRIRPQFGADARLQVVERVHGAEAELAKVLDVDGGVDAYVVTAAEGVRAIASRVQFGVEQYFKTFTIRLRRSSGVMTELDKLWRAVRHGATRPQLHLHAYVSETGRDFKALAMMPTITLLRSIFGPGRDGLNRDAPASPWGVRSTDNAVFLHATWADLLAEDLPVTIIHHDVLTADAYFAVTDAEARMRQPDWRPSPRPTPGSSGALAWEEVRPRPPKD